MPQIKIVISIITLIIASLNPVALCANDNIVTMQLTEPVKIWHIAVIGNKAYAATENALWQKSSGKKQWSQLLTNTEIYDLEIYGDHLLVGTTKGIIRISAKASKKTPFNKGLGKFLRVIRIENTDGHLYAVAYNSPTIPWDDMIFEWNKSSQSWKQISMTWILHGDKALIHSIDVLMRLNDTLYAGREGGADVCGVYKLKDKSPGWINAGEFPGCYPILNLTAIGDHIYARSFDSVLDFKPKSKTWEKIEKGLPKDRMLSSMISCNSFIYASSDKGIFRLKEGRRSWKKITSGKCEKDVSTLTAYNKKIYAGTATGAVCIIPCSQN